MGFEKNEQTEIKNEKTSKTVEVSTKEKNYESELLLPSESPKVSSKTTLKVIIEDLKSDQKEWPREFLNAVQRRFGRMPRNGWNQALSAYCGKFEIHMTLENFKWMANKCLEKRSIEESEKRLKVSDETLKMISMFKDRIYLKAKNLFLDVKEK